MVLKEAKLISNDRLAKILDKKAPKLKEEILAETRKPRRIPQQPAPQGGIGIRQASRKYGIPDGTICKWVKRGLIPVLLETPNIRYISEPHLLQIKDKYTPGKGRRPDNLYSFN